MTARNPEHGFTLLELLISLAIMAMIAVLIGTSLSSSARILTRSAAYSVDVDRALARRDLRLAVEAILPLPFPENTAPLFEGTADRVRFQAGLDDGVFWPGAPVFGELAKLDGGQIVLVLEGLSDAAQQEFRSITLLSGPEGDLDISYFGARSVREAPAWFTTWPADQGIPLLIKLRLADGNDAVPTIMIQPAKRFHQSEMSLSSLVPPATPSRP